MKESTPTNHMKFSRLDAGQGTYDPETGTYKARFISKPVGDSWYLLWHKFEVFISFLPCITGLLVVAAALFFIFGYHLIGVPVSLGLLTVTMTAAVLVSLVRTTQMERDAIQYLEFFIKDLAVYMRGPMGHVLIDSSAVVVKTQLKAIIKKDQQGKPFKTLMVKSKSGYFGIALVSCGLSNLVEVYAMALHREEAMIELMDDPLLFEREFAESIEP